MPMMTKRQFEELFREEVLPHVIDRYERDGVPDRPARREAWNDTVDGYIRDRTLPEAAGNWSHPRWLETWRPPLRHHATRAHDQKTPPAQLDREIAESLSNRHGVDTVQPRSRAGQPLPASRPAPPPHGVDTVRPRRLAGQPLPASRPAPPHGVDTIQPRSRAAQPYRQAPPPHGVDTVQPRRLAGQPLPASRPAPPPHGVDTIRPRRATETSHATRKKIGASPRPSKTRIIYVVQGSYGYGHGWEDLTAEETREEILKRLREYRANEPGVSFRWIRRRERIAP